MENGDQKKGRTAVVGIRMTPEMEQAVKVEAASRTISVADLFEEMWKLFKSDVKGEEKKDG